MYTVLSLGCGLGNELKKYFSSNNKVIGIDIDQTNIEHCKKHYPKGEWIQADLLEYDFTQHNPDHIVCFEVLEHIPDWKAVVSKLKDAKKGTTLHITVPYEASEKKLIAQRKTYWSEIGHHNFFNGSEMKQALEAQDFQITIQKRTNAYLYFTLRALFKKNARCIRNTYYENNLPLIQKLFYQLFSKTLFETKLRYIPVWIITLPIAIFILDPLFGATIETKAIKKST